MCKYANYRRHELKIFDSLMFQGNDHFFETASIKISGRFRESSSVKTRSKQLYCVQFFRNFEGKADFSTNLNYFCTVLVLF